ncbi:MAG: PRC and DUF2382 domain-containing protein [Austwickia sp.]|jgi:uncharacterized protein (TIGR02271 family)|nr:PRC and DUF2382 domain-containing protein [Austwickia sp.]MBK8435352.1 PRC and DUF2382 domain-containing protein [Austwickia sp.]MBK9101100.1 PRC and DUF2382 domain-containing protein [Austwickia sp.]
MFDRTMTQDQLAELHHAHVVAEDGEKIGDVGQVYLDDHDDRPTWVTVKTGWFGMKESFIPLDGASMSDSQVRVPFTKDHVKGAPSIDADHHITPEEEEELYRYYHRAPAGEARAEQAEYANHGRGHDAGADHVATAEMAGADSVVRHEEELRVGTERVATGRVRLRKYVVTEEKTVTVPVQREEVRLETEPIQPGEVDAGVIGEDEVSVTLYEERPVVEKTVVAKERVGLGKETLAEQSQVTETVAKEQVSVDHDDAVDRDGHAHR